jgi:hypothetical protein
VISNALAAAMAAADNTPAPPPLDPTAPAPAPVVVAVVVPVPVVVAVAGSKRDLLAGFRSSREEDCAPPSAPAPAPAPSWVLVSLRARFLDDPDDPDAASDIALAVTKNCEDDVCGIRVSE